MSAARILVVEDDLAIAGGLARVLSAQGYAVECASTGTDALAREADLVLLDLGLPDLDGVEVCRRMRSAQPGTTIVMLTARTEEIDVVVGLEAGADDYLVKPFRLAELLARVRAHVHRGGGRTPQERLACGDLSADVDARRAWLGGAELALRAKEFDLLALLLQEAGNVVRRESIMQAVWDQHWHGSTKTLDMHILALRRMIDEADGPSRITTLRGVGYRLELPLP